MTIPPHQQRVIHESAELRTKMDKLGDFISSSEIFDGLPEEEKLRLKRQYKIMELYLDVLEERIAQF